jgi:hypothetical protein
VNSTVTIPACPWLNPIDRTIATPGWPTATASSSRISRSSSLGSDPLGKETWAVTVVRWSPQ